MNSFAREPMDQHPKKYRRSRAIRSSPRKSFVKLVNFHVYLTGEFLRSGAHRSITTGKPNTGARSVATGQHRRYCSGAYSKGQFQSELNLARRADNARDRSGIARTNRRIWQIELGMVEEIEKFGAELQLQAFNDAELFEDREVEIHTSWPIQNIAA